MYIVSNAEGVIHNCHTKERYDKFKASGWKDHSSSDNKKGTKSKPSAKEKR